MLQLFRDICYLRKPEPADTDYTVGAGTTDAEINIKPMALYFKSPITTLLPPK